MRRGRIIARGMALGVFLLLTLAMTSSANAEFAIVPGSVEFRTVDSKGESDNRAGAHPDRLQVAFELNAEGTGTSARDYIFEFAPGLGGNADAGPTCPRPVFEDEACPPSTQVGIFTLKLGGGESFGEPIYSIAPAPDQLAAFGFKPFWKTQFEMDLRPTDYGLRLFTTELPQLPVNQGQVELWGIPADHVAVSPAPERVALLTTPTRCGPLKVTFRTRSWEVGAPWLSETVESDPFAGCENLPFEPRFGLQLSNTMSDTPTGIRIELSMPEYDDPDELVGSYLEDVRIDLPPGVTVSPGGAEGMDVCSDGQFGLGTESPIACPFLSQVGSVEFSTDQLSEPLVGSIYLGEERPHERFRLFVGAAARGTEFKLQGRLVADLQTGQLAAVLSDLPQAALNRITLNLEGGSQSLLATPLSCGRATARGRFVPYSGGEPVESLAIIDIASRRGPSCPSLLPFSPDVAAGSTEAKAGRGGDFSLTLTRQDEEQLPKRLSVTLPPGLNATLRAVDLCQDAAAALGSCTNESRIGSAVAEIGSGSSPALVHGNVYLTESYRRAPFGLSVVFNASVGPFDLGALHLRGMLRLDRRTGQVTIETDPLPSIFEGIPMRFRTIGMDLDRPGLLRNPTSCEPKEIVSTVYAMDGRTASITSPFTVQRCNALGFRPKLGLMLTDRAEFHDGGHPGLRLAVQMRRGTANLRRFRVEFPRPLAFHGAGVQEICARGDAMEGLCPKGSRVGTGFARTPVLKQPLRGPIYLVQPRGNGFPDLWSSIEGRGVVIDVAGETLWRDGRLVTEIVDLPDMPLSKFTMHLRGGKAGLFSLNSSLCTGGRPRHLFSPIEAEAQNGAYRLARVPVRAKARCGGARDEGFSRDGRARIGSIR
jgi:hypothetical protein